MDELRNVFESAYDRLFTEIVNIDSIPKDYDENELFFRIPEIFDRNFNDNKKTRMFLRKKINKRDKGELKRIIKNRLTEYLEEYPKRRTAEMYRQIELLCLNNLQSELCPNWQGLHQNRQFEIYHDLEAYKEALLELVPEQTNKTTNRKKSEELESNWHPFKSREVLKCFEYLNSNYHNKKKVRWTYLYHEITEYDTELGETEYFRFIRENYQSDVANRLQPNANSIREGEKLRELSEQYKQIQANKVQE